MKRLRSSMYPLFASVLEMRPKVAVGGPGLILDVAESLPSRNWRATRQRQDESASHKRDPGICRSSGSLEIVAMPINEGWHDQECDDRCSEYQ